MSEAGTGKTRVDSLARKAFTAASEGYQTEISLEVYPTVQYPTSLSKVSRCLVPDGDMNPPWQLLDQILSVNGEAVLRTLLDEMGFEPPRRRVSDPAAAYRELTETLKVVQRTLLSVEAQRKQIERVVRKVEPERKRGVG